MVKRSKVLGSILALISAASFALNLVLAGVSYEHGANVHSLNLVRAVLFFVILGAYILTSRTSFTIPTKAKFISLLVGMLLCTEMYALLGAIITIPVALAVLIFYTYPILIACVKWVLREEKFRWLSLLLMVIGFSGLVFVMISAPPAQLDPVGVALAIISPLVMAAMLITSEHNLVKYDDQVVLFYALATVVAIVFVASLTAVELLWPIGSMGWVVFAGSSIFYVVATFTLFKAVSMIGPLRTAIIDNTAPVWAILFGYLMLSQTLTLKQLLGSGCVVAAVMLLQLTLKSNATEKENVL